MTEEVIEIFGILKLANKFVVMKKLKSSKIPAEKSKPLLSDSDLDMDETEDDDYFCIYEEEVSNLSDGMMATLNTLTKSQPIHGTSPTQWSSSESRRPVIKSLSDLDPFTCRPCNNYFKNPQHFKFHRDWHRGDLNHKCPECTKTFKGRCEVNRHMVPIHGRPLGDKEETLHKKGDQVQKLEIKQFAKIKETCDLGPLDASPDEI